MSNGDATWVFKTLLLGLWMKWGGQFSLEIVLLPHFVRGSCQLLLSRTDTFGMIL